MINPIRAWTNFFFRPISAKPLGAIRILYGLTALFNLALCAVDLDYWYTDAGLLPGDEAWVVAGTLQYSLLHFYQDPTTVRVFFGLTALAAFFLTIGWRSRLMSILFYIGMLTIHNRNLVSSSGADVLLIIFAFNLMLCPSGAAYSVDAWLSSRKRGTPADPIIVPWAYRLIQIQACVVYTMAGLLKLGGNLWLNGTALHYVFNNSEVSRCDLSFLSQYPLLINVMTYMALVMEICLAFFLWFRVTRPWVIPMGLMLHAGIMVSINIPIFGELMWISYLAFLTPPEFDALVRAVDVRRLWQRSGSTIESDPRTESRPSMSSYPSFGPASILVKLDGVGSLMGPYRIDVAPARSIEDGST